MYETENITEHDDLAAYKGKWAVCVVHKDGSKVCKDRYPTLALAEENIGQSYAEPKDSGYIYKVLDDDDTFICYEQNVCMFLPIPVGA